MKKFSLLIMFVLFVFAATTAQAFFIDFESGFGKDQQAIDDIIGVTFEVTGGYDWIYGDSNSNNWNTKSIDLGLSWNGAYYQHYGYVFAFLGTDNNAGSGKIDFTNNDGTWFKTGYTSYSNFYLEGYDSSGNLIASASGSGNLNGSDMGWLMITAPSGQFFDYVMVHDSGNYFLVDNMSGDASGVNPIPEPATLLLLGAGLVGVGIARRFRK
ncbi:MAG: PEP-CTERM sorting domain-containing protein [Nitrospirae bacterium]|nr:PEP-CTERM sorting domain-containing protein [Nitrospirota bacterium]